MSNYGSNRASAKDDDDRPRRPSSGSGSSSSGVGVAGSIYGGGPIRSINQLLQKALEDAANPGEGDEEPEVLAAPDGVDADDSAERLSRRQAEKIAAEKKRAIEDEERRVAELTFDPDALIPFDDMKERARFIPVRLTYEERKNLRLVNACINVSDYSNAVDVAFKNKAKRHHTQLQYIVAFLSGIVAAMNYEDGQRVLEDRNFGSYEEVLQNTLEIARRYKITNPEKMRSEYGKLVYLMQDAVSADTKPLLGVDINTPVRTVYMLLEQKGGLALLDDPAIGTATAEVLPDKSKNRSQIQLEIKRKERAAEQLSTKYATRELSKEDIRACLYSISDNNSFLNSNKKPIVDCARLLEQYFHPTLVAIDPRYSMSIAEGQGGSRLSHDHLSQYNYVRQSLALWAAIVEDMFRLWYLSELDLLAEEQPYELKNTGQGLQRVQLSPRVYRAMHEILARTQKAVGGWVGSSVIHLGDSNVPNTLVFIDKYTQVSRILGPLVKTLENLENACSENEGLDRYMRAYGGIEKAKKDILHDFFTHAFDGSGGDNFFDAGSCIDGRLTSAWNWCSQLANKPYYPLFRLTGFLSFDGQFDN